MIKMTREDILKQIEKEPVKIGKPDSFVRSADLQKKIQELVDALNAGDYPEHKSKRIFKHPQIWRLINE